ncbi:MAG: bacterioferritin [Actinomycetota bacterium]|nr:bacterioferritin [Actinomycetota bacterium]
MKGHARVIELLNECLTAELTAINQYFIDAKMCANWGYERLAGRFREDSIDEMRDAEALVDRILYLEGMPNLQRLGTVAVGETVGEKLAAALDLEVAAVQRLNQGIATCMELADHGSREVLQAILRGEEQHADWLEAQLGLITQLGEANYLAQQLRS